VLKLRSEGTIDLPCSIRRTLQSLRYLVLVCCFAEIVCRLLLTMAVLLAPETEVIARAVTLGGEIKCLALLALFFLAIQYPFDLDPLPTSEDVMRSSYWGDRTLAGSRNF